ncbi:MAG: cytochrome-c peroxidase, partial [Methyloligellaceae bacterium]
MKLWQICVLILFSLAIPLVAIAQKSNKTEIAIERLKNPPLGLPPLKPDQYQELTPAIIKLGRKLFFEKALSRDGSISCATCHKPKEAFTENGFITSPGFKEQKNRRNTPSLLNVMYFARLHHDGRETSLETQFILPLTAHDEMASPSPGFAVTKLGWMPEYQKLFKDAFNAPPSLHTLGRHSRPIKKHCFQETRVLIVGTMA